MKRFLISGSILLAGLLLTGCSSRTAKQTTSQDSAQSAKVASLKKENSALKKSDSAANQKKYQQVKTILAEATKQYELEDFQLAAQTLDKLKDTDWQQPYLKSLKTQYDVVKQDLAQQNTHATSESASSSAAQASSVQAITPQEASALIIKGGFTDYAPGGDSADNHSLANGGYEVVTYPGAKGKDIFTLTPRSDGTVYITAVYGTLDGGSFSVLSDQSIYGPSEATVQR
jgi:outer membrane murein-binding lipoprotein Lpp